MSRSNIDVRSNIYIRSPETYSQSKDSPEKDDNFVLQIMDANALRELQARAEEKEIDLNISEAQWQLLVIKPCEHCATGEMTHGLVRRDGQIIMECRCSVEDCPHSDKCGRSVIAAEETTEEEDIFAELSRLGMDIKNIFANPEGEEISQETEDESPAYSAVMQAVSELMGDKDEYFDITADDAAARVIEAPLSDVIFLNGAAGSGKTYTAVERLTSLLRKTDKKPRILMLCCTDNTANEIKTRIEQKISRGELSENASFTALGTLDVLVMKYLADKGVPVAKLRGMSYKERALLFEEKLDKADFAEFDYCIIDELHEVTDERAQVVLGILKSLKCGCLLLEDKYQAIFDYGINSSEVMDIAAFYRSLRELYPNGVKKYTLLGNKRQSENLDKMTEVLRSQLLDDKNVSDICKKQLAQLPQTLIDGDFEVISIKGETAILCMKNGDAEYISWLLNKNKVRHTLMRENTQGASLGRYLADVLWDWHEDTITRENFVKRFIMRCDSSKEKADAFFTAIADYSDKRNNSDVLDCTALAEKICCGGELPAVVMNARDEMLTISTIKRAKGREFDKVYLLGYDFSDASATSKNGHEERMFYLAETRPKSDLEVLRHSARLTFRRNENNRWIRTIRDAYKERSKCVGFGTGDSEDLDYYSFVEGTIAEAVQRQAYISENVKCGDEVYLHVCGDIYEIVHGDTVIGKMSHSYSENLLGEFGGRKYVEKLPERISELFVTNIITFASLDGTENGSLSKVSEQFRKKRFWLGVEISGFGTI